MRRLLSSIRRTSLVAALAGLLFALASFHPSGDLSAARYALGHYDDDQALRLARRAALFGDDDLAASALQVAAQAALRSGRRDIALRYLSRAATLDPGCGLCLLQRGELLSGQKRYQEAAQAFEQGFRLAPALDDRQEARFRARWALSLLRSGRLKEGCRQAARAGESQADSPLALFAVALCSSARNQPQRAAREAEKGYALGMKAPFFFSREREEAGEDWLRVYTELVSGAGRIHRRAEKLWQQGQALYAAGKTGQALTLFQQSHDLEPDPDKGSYIAWLMGQLDEQPHQVSKPHPESDTVQKGQRTR